MRMGIQERRPRVISVTRSQGIVFSLVDDYDILIIYDGHLHGSNTTGAYLLV